MPIYEYKCDKCGYQFTDLEPMDSVTERSCPMVWADSGVCDGVARRIPSAPSPPIFNCSMPTYQKPKGT